MNNILRFILVLFLVNFLAASILTGVYYVTNPKIESEERSAREKALIQVMPRSVGERIEPVERDGKTVYWKVFKGPGVNLRGYIFIAKKYGYSSVIETMVGVKKDGTITGINILNQNETPGLGAKIVEVASGETLLGAIKGIFSKEKSQDKTILPYFTEQFIGRDVKNIDISNIDAITGATISSKAVTDSIKEEWFNIKP